MKFTFAQVEKTLALTHNVDETRRSAFAARLKHLQKMKFPPGVNTGRGRAASYDVGHICLLGVALELNQLGLSPERAVGVITSDHGAIASAFLRAAEEGPPNGSFLQPMFLYLDPAGLTDLMIDHGRDRAARSFYYIDLDSLIKNLQKWGTGGLSRLSLVSVSAMLWDLASYSRRQKDPETSAFYEAAKEWASSVARTAARTAAAESFAAFVRTRPDQGRRRLLDRTDFARGKPNKGKV